MGIIGFFRTIGARHEDLKQVSEILVAFMPNVSDVVMRGGSYVTMNTVGISLTITVMKKKQFIF